MHFQCVENALKNISIAFWNVGNVFQRHRNALESISKSFQNIVNAFSNIDNAFNETAGRLESFIEPPLSVFKIFTMKC